MSAPSRKRAELEPRTRLHRRLRTEITVRSYGPGLVRILLVRENAEITCTSKELDVLFPFVCLTLGRSMANALPVREFKRAPWSPRYRWTVRANAVYVADREKHGVAT